MTDESIRLFHPLIQQWFLEEVGHPTDIQQKSWPQIASGRHLLITAPTGSGKTLTAFLWAIHQLMSGAWEPGAVQVLYVSPLKALNNDIRRNLLAPLQRLSEIFRAEGVPFPEIQVMTRSGDTSQEARRKMRRRPPEILITTPESLNLMLSSHGGRSLFPALKCVILDEIHHVAGNRRGTYLITAVERLTRLSGEFQRIGLSATVRPLERVALFMGGYRKTGAGYTPRPVQLIRSDMKKAYDLRVCYTEESGKPEEADAFWVPMVEAFQRIIQKNRSTLIFANGRRLTEKLALKINFGQERPVAYAHHGSLSREIRTDVEKKLKAGDLKAIVATNSLEMGIDIGSLDEVLLVQSPKSISSAIQRAGRAGHQVGQVSRTRFYPTHDHDFLESAVLARTISDGDIEAVRPIENPMDVLAQIIISMTAMETWHLDDLYDFIRTAAPYHSLKRQPFDLVIRMLAGRYADTRIRELDARVFIDSIDETISAKKGALLNLYLSGGVIPERGHFNLRHHESGSLIGDLDEEFVWEAKIGQIFSLGSQNWRIQRITHNDVFVKPGPANSLATPFWRAEPQHRDYHFAMKIADFLEEADARVVDIGFQDELVAHYHLEEKAARQLVDFLKRQKSATGRPLPHRHHVLLEHVQTGPGGAPGHQLILHLPWGGRLNRPLAMALESAWEAAFHQTLEVFASDDCIILQLAHDIPAHDFLGLIHAGNVEAHLRNRVEGSGFFGARFRECAGRALLVTKRQFKQRMPLWMVRLKSQKLLQAIRKFDDFPILLETWRTTLQDEFDLDNLKNMLTELEQGAIQISECHTSTPSPMVKDAAFQQINDYMYRTDEPDGDASSHLNATLLRDLVFNPGLRPAVSTAIIQEYLNKRQRLAPGYSPSSAADLVDWVKERVLIPWKEWQALLDCITRDQDDSPEILATAQSRLVQLKRGNDIRGVLPLETWESIAAVFWPADESWQAVIMNSPDHILPLPKIEMVDEESLQPAPWLEQWLRFYGPLDPGDIARQWHLSHKCLQEVLQDLLEEEKLIAGPLVTDSRQEWVCDAENYEILLRMARRAASPVFQPRPLKELPRFMARWQGVSRSPASKPQLRERLEQLLCLPLPAGFWEKEVLPARFHPYQGSRLNELLTETDIIWLGAPGQRLLFTYTDERELLSRPSPDNDLHALFPDASARYDFSTLMSRGGLTPGTLSQKLWDGVWNGILTNDSFATVRKGVLNQFTVPDAADNASLRPRHGRTGYRSRYARWKGAIPFSGNWYLLPVIEESDDFLEKEEMSKDRVRQLLDRYGILFRQLLDRETEPFQWKHLFRTLRIMEFSGEILAGYFFENLPGPQFISPAALARLKQNSQTSDIWWINAADPASCCGLAIDGLKAGLPRRVEGNYLVYRGSDLVMTVEARGKRIHFSVPPDDDALQAILAPLHHLLEREFSPVKRIVIEEINGENAGISPYLPAFRTGFECNTENKKAVLYRKH